MHKYYTYSAWGSDLASRILRTDDYSLFFSDVG